MGQLLPLPSGLPQLLSHGSDSVRQPVRRAAPAFPAACELLCRPWAGRSFAHFSLGKVSVEQDAAEGRGRAAATELPRPPFPSDAASRLFLDSSLPGAQSESVSPQLTVIISQRICPREGLKLFIFHQRLPTCVGSLIG